MDRKRNKKHSLFLSLFILSKKVEKRKRNKEGGRFKVEGGRDQVKMVTRLGETCLIVIFSSIFPMKEDRKRRGRKQLVKTS